MIAAGRGEITALPTRGFGVNTSPADRGPHYDGDCSS